MTEESVPRRFHVALERRGYSASIVTAGANYTLRWSDGINEWAEMYPTVSLALARLAVLDHVVTNDESLVESTAVGFALKAQPWIDARGE